MSALKRVKEQQEPILLLYLSGSWLSFYDYNLFFIFLSFTPSKTCVVTPNLRVVEKGNVIIFVGPIQQEV